MFTEYVIHKDGGWKIQPYWLVVYLLRERAVGQVNVYVLWLGEAMVKVFGGSDFHRVQGSGETDELRAEFELLSKCGRGEGRVLFFC